MESNSPYLDANIFVRALPQNQVAPEELIQPPPDESSTSNTLWIKITAKLTCPVVDGEEEEEEGETLGIDTERRSRTIKFWKLFSMPLDTLIGRGIEACDAVIEMLSAVHIPYWNNAVCRILDWVRRVVNERQLGHRDDDDDRTARDLRIEVYVDADVEELPEPSEGENYVILTDDDSEAESDSFDSYVIYFEPASAESIEGLEKVRIPVEKAVNCLVCLDDVVVGSEAIRLPCSHFYHGHCIVKWLQTSRFCPLCRFELP